MAPPLFYGPWKATPSLVKLTDVLSRRGTPAYFLESHLPRGGGQVEQEVRARGRAPHPCAPRRMPPLTWTDWNTKVAGKGYRKSSERAGPQGRELDQWSRGVRRALEGCTMFWMAKGGSSCLSAPCFYPLSPPRPTAPSF